MADYNDGKWHGWNGGECPVGPDAEVEPIWIDGRTARSRLTFRAARISWGGAFDVPIAFRVTKPAPPKPREWWLRMDSTGHIHGVDPVDGDPPPNWNMAAVIKVREVLPE